jgi:hypothetical protein
MQREMQTRSPLLSKPRFRSPKGQASAKKRKSTKASAKGTNISSRRGSTKSINKKTPRNLKENTEHSKTPTTLKKRSTAFAMANIEINPFKTMNQSPRRTIQPNQ